MRIRVGLESTKILLTEVGKKWFTWAYPKDIMNVTAYEYDEDKPFDLRSMGTNFVEITPPLGGIFMLPIHIKGEITFKMADKEEAD